MAKMTNEEAIRTLQDNIDTWIDCPCPEHDKLQGDIVEIPIDNNDITAFSMGIEAIRQKKLDKIRAEIVDLGQRAMNDNRANGIWACVDIIDKYKAEKRKNE